MTEPRQPSDHRQDDCGIDGELRLMREVFDATGVGLIAFDGQGHITLSNRRFAEIYCLPDHLVARGTHLLDLVNYAVQRSIFRDPAVPHYAGHLMGMLGQRDTIDTAWKLADGRVIALDLKRMPNNQWLASHRDITDQRRAERKLAESEQRFRDFVSTASDWVWETDADHRYTYVSPEFAQLAGRTVEELIGATRLDLAITEEDRGVLEAHRDDLAARKPFQNLTYRLRTSDGRVVWKRASGIPRFDRRGHFLGYRGTGTDVTVEQESKAKARLHEEKLRDFLGTASDWTWETDREHRVISLSKAYDANGVFSMSSMLGQRRDEHPVLDEYRERMAEYNATLDARLPLRNFVYGVWGSDGSAHYVRVSGNPVFDQNGEFIGYRGTSTNVTREVETQIHLNASYERFRDFAESASDWFWETDAEHRYIDPTVFLGRKPGFGSKAYVGHRRIDLPLIPEDRPTLERHMEDLAARRPFEGLEYRVPEENGSISWLRVRGHPIYGVDGQFIGYRGSARDITAEKQRELSEKARHQALAAAAERATELTLTLSHITQGITMFDAKGCLILWNDRYVELLGLDSSRLRVGMHASELFALRVEIQAFREETDKQLRDFLARIARGETEREIKTTSSGRSIETISSPVRGGGWVSTHEDITERASLVERLIASSNAEASRSRQLRLTLEHMNHGLTMFDANHRLVVWNDQFAGMFELAPDDIRTGMHALEIVEMQQRHGSYAESPVDTLAAAQASFKRGEVVKSTHYRPSGRTISSQSNPIPGGGWVTLHEDVSERVRAVERINHAALHDGLTGLANRVALKQEIQQQLERRVNLGEPHFSVMLIDLDRFKYVNDTFGHAVGDAVLRCVSERMKASVRTDDIVSRLGGDEFAILYRPGANHRESSIVIATRLLQALSSPFEVDGRQVVLGASIGIALAPEHGKDVDELMRNADAALYKVKGHTRNAFRIFDEEIEREASARRDLEADLRVAVSNMEFELAFQPLVELSTRRINTVETLLRWRHPVRGAVSPAIFVPILESSGLINTVGDWVIEKACEEARRLPPEVRVAVNVSPVQMRNRSLLDVVVPALLRSHLNPGRLEIEVTESVLLEDDKDLLADLHRLRELGVTISLDDFGTGYSSLSYLRMFPFDKLKIDRSFVTDLGVREDCTAIVCSVIGLAKSLNVISVAEGIETEDQALLLRAAGCDLGQGYLFSRPVPMDDVVSRMTEGTLIPDMARLTA